MNTLSSRLLLALGLAVMMTSSAQATTVLETAPALGSYGDAYIDCSVVNGSDVAPAVITVEQVAYNGSVVAAEQQKYLPPKGSYILAGPGNAASCRFTVVAGSHKSIHAAAMYVRNAVGGIDMVVPAR